MEGPAERHDPRIGMLVQDRYRIVRKLGEGGMGAVYEVRHELIGRRLALKCLHAHFIHDAETVERFHREAKAATAIGHEHIIDVTDMGQFPDGSPYIVLEHLQGVELADLIHRRAPLPVQRVAHVAVQVCSALQAAHDKGIIHRDLKPENIFLIPRHGDDDFVKVLDFGISKMKESAERAQRSLTQSGTALGTPYYMAPEQARALPDLDHRVDIYALGVILYEAATATLPFDAESYPALMVKILTDAPPPLRMRRPDVPEHFEDVVMRMIAKDRAERFRSMHELAHALRPCAEGTPVPAGATRRMPQPTSAHDADAPSQPPSSVSRPPVRRRARRVSALAAGLVLSLGGAGAVWATGALDVATNAPDTPPDTPGSPSPSAHSGTTEPPSRTRPSKIANAPQPAPEEVRVEIQARPENAHIYIDGVEFPNPMNAHRPRSLEPVRIRVERRGYRSVEQLAIFDRDRSFRYRLQRGRGTREIPHRKARDRETTPSKAKSQSTTNDTSFATGDDADAKLRGSTHSKTRLQKPKGPEDTGKPNEPSTSEPETTERAPSDGTYRGPTGTIRDEF